VVNFNELTRVIINLLIKSHRHLIGVNLFHLPSLPALFANHIVPVSPSSSGKILPIGEFPFVLLTRTHLILSNPEESRPWPTLIAGPVRISHDLRTSARRCSCSEKDSAISRLRVR